MGRFLFQVPLLELIAYITLVLSSALGEEVHAFCDADWNNSDQHLSTSGYVVMHGTNPIASLSQTQFAWPAE
jgi:hypothetical protein